MEKNVDREPYQQWLVEAREQEPSVTQEEERCVSLYGNDGSWYRCKLKSGHDGRHYHPIRKLRW